MAASAFSAVASGSFQRDGATASPGVSTSNRRASRAKMAARTRSKAEPSWRASASMVMPAPIRRSTATSSAVKSAMKRGGSPRRSTVERGSRFGMRLELPAACGTARSSTSNHSLLEREGWNWMPSRDGLSERDQTTRPLVSMVWPMASQ